MSLHFIHFLWICLAGAVGTGARYLTSELVQHTFGELFPHSTFLINIIGSFLMSIIMVVGLSTNAISPTLRIILTTGLLGGFTTYSSFNYETLQYFQNGEFGRGMVYMFGTVLTCLLAGVAGLWLARRMMGA
jgi:CrcB protein